VFPAGNDRRETKQAVLAVDEGQSDMYVGRYENKARLMYRRRNHHPAIGLVFQQLAHKGASNLFTLPVQKIQFQTSS
jgi:hypothetical protein